MANEEKSLASQRIGWYPGHMAKTKKNIKENLNFIDVVYEVIDARMPISSKIVDIDELIGNKKRILIMTKYDLCDKEKTDPFIKHYEKLGYQVVPVDLITRKNIKKILELSNEISTEITKKRATKGLKPRSLRALIVGIPNVGKSTLINSLVGKKVALVANRPGFTKGLSWIRIGKNIELLDSPGILWPKLENQHQAKILALLGTIKEDILNKEDLAYFGIELMLKYYKENLANRYEITTISNDPLSVMEQIAKRCGALVRGGEVDYSKVSNIILTDIKNNSFGNITLDRIENEQ